MLKKKEVSTEKRKTNKKYNFSSVIRQFFFNPRSKIYIFVGALGLLLSITVDTKELLLSNNTPSVVVNAAYQELGVQVNDAATYQNVKIERQVFCEVYQENVVYYNGKEINEQNSTESDGCYELTVPQIVVLHDHADYTLTMTSSTATVPIVSSGNVVNFPLGFRYVVNASFGLSEERIKRCYYVKSLDIGDNEFEIIEVNAVAYIMVQCNDFLNMGEAQYVMIPVLNYFDWNCMSTTNGLVQGELSDYAVPLNAICTELEYENFNIPNRLFNEKNDMTKSNPNAAMMLDSTWKFYPLSIYEITYKDVYDDIMNMHFYDAAELGMEKLFVAYDENKTTAAQQEVFSEVVKLQSYSGMAITYLVPMFGTLSSIPVLDPVDCASVSAGWGKANLQQANPWAKRVWEELCDIMK